MMAITVTQNFSTEASKASRTTSEEIITLGASNLKGRIKTSIATMKGYEATDLFSRTSGYASSTTTTVRSKYYVEVSGDDVMINCEPKSLGRPVAEAIAEVFRSRVRDITATAAEATLKARRAAANGLAKGKAWALKRYAGGKTGEMPPTGDRLFNDSGRLAQSFAVGANDEGWIVNVAANRLNPDTLDNGGVSALERIYARLVSFVPELGDPALLMSNLSVRRAINQTIEDAIIVANERTAAVARAQLMAEINGVRAIAQGFLTLVA